MIIEKVFTKKDNNITMQPFTCEIPMKEFPLYSIKGVVRSFFNIKTWCFEEER
jgi:hypothetical protein